MRDAMTSIAFRFVAEISMLPFDSIAISCMTHRHICYSLLYALCIYWKCKACCYIFETFESNINMPKLKGGCCFMKQQNPIYTCWQLRNTKPDCQVVYPIATPLVLKLRFRLLTFYPAGLAGIWWYYIEISVTANLTCCNRNAWLGPYAHVQFPAVDPIIYVYRAYISLHLNWGRQRAIVDGTPHSNLAELFRWMPFLPKPPQSQGVQDRDIRYRDINSLQHDLTKVEPK